VPSLAATAFLPILTGQVPTAFVQSILSLLASILGLFPGQAGA
jgi:hypothetical protein